MPLSSIPAFLTFTAKIQHLQEQADGECGMTCGAVTVGQQDIDAVTACKTFCSKVIIPAAVQNHWPEQVSRTVLDIAQLCLGESAKGKSQIRCSGKAPCIGASIRVFLTVLRCGIAE